MILPLMTVFQRAATPVLPGNDKSSPELLSSMKTAGAKRDETLTHPRCVWNLLEAASRLRANAGRRGKHLRYAESGFPEGV